MLTYTLPYQGVFFNKIILKFSSSFLQLCLQLSLHTFIAGLVPNGLLSRWGPFRLKSSAELNSACGNSPAPPSNFLGKPSSNSKASSSLTALPPAQPSYLHSRACSQRAFIPLGPFRLKSSAELNSACGNSPAPPSNFLGNPSSNSKASSSLIALPPAQPSYLHSRACPGAQTCSSYRPPRRAGRRG